MINEKDRFGKILSHPDLDQIISRLVNGDSVREIESWLKSKYLSKEKHISHNNLDAFRREHLNMSGNFVDDIRQKVNEQRKEEINEDLKNIVKKNKTYSEKMEEFVDTQIDLKKKIYQFMSVMETRFGQLYDMTQNNPSNMKPDRYMIEYITKMLDMIREIKKIEGAPDQVIQHNVAIQAIDQQTFIFQEAITQAIQELPLDIASKVIDKINTKLNLLKSPEQPTYLYTQKEVDKVEKIAAPILKQNILEAYIQDDDNGDKENE